MMKELENGTIVDGESYEGSLKHHFSRILAYEQKIRDLQAKARDAATAIGFEINTVEREAEGAWSTIRGIMESAGVVSETLPGEADSPNDYQLSFSTPRESVDVPDVEAVPDDFVKLKKEADKKKIGDYLKAGNTPNWASMKLGESKLSWRPVKRK